MKKYLCAVPANVIDWADILHWDLDRAYKILSSYSEIWRVDGSDCLAIIPISFDDLRLCIPGQMDSRGAYVFASSDFVDFLLMITPLPFSGEVARGSRERAGASKPTRMGARLRNQSK